MYYDALRNVNVQSKLSNARGFKYSDLSKTFANIILSGSGKRTLSLFLFNLGLLEQLFGGKLGKRSETRIDLISIFSQSIEYHTNIANCRLLISRYKISSESNSHIL